MEKIPCVEAGREIPESAKEDGCEYCEFNMSRDSTDSMGRKLGEDRYCELGYWEDGDNNVDYSLILNK